MLRVKNRHLLCAHLLNAIVYQVIRQLEAKKTTRPPRLVFYALYKSTALSSDGYKYKPVTSWNMHKSYSNSKRKLVLEFFYHGETFSL